VAGDPTILFCIGATKAGTSSLYRYLHGHPECHMRSIKEIHFFDTVDFDNYDRQFDAYARLRANLTRRQAIAAENGNKWKFANLARQIADVDEVVTLLKQGAAGETAYLRYLLAGVDGHKLVGDITPAYALLSEDRLARMATMAPDVRFVFLMRDPVDRLWSHVRMQAIRQRQPGQDVALKARRILNRTVKKGMETHIPLRGDYRAILGKLARAVPQDRVFIGFTEDVLDEDGLAPLCDFLGISYLPNDGAPREHEGMDLALDAAQRRDAAEFLAPQYAFAAQTFGTLPRRWQSNMAKV